MTRRQTTPATRTRIPGQPGQRERTRAKKILEQYQEWFKALPPEERRAERRRRQASAVECVPSLAVAESDLLKLFLAVGAEFINRYFPNTTGASLIILDPYGTGGVSAKSVCLPIPGGRCRAAELPPETLSE